MKTQLTQENSEISLHRIILDIIWHKWNGRSFLARRIFTFYEVKWKFAIWHKFKTLLTLFNIFSYKNL